MNKNIRMISFAKDREKLKLELKKFFIQDMIVPIIGSGFSLGEKTSNGYCVSSGREMKKHMISEISRSSSDIPKSELESMGELDFSMISAIYNDEIDDWKKKKYIRNRFTDVKLSTEKKAFINIPFKTMYTLNIDDAIENNNDDVEIVIPNQKTLDEGVLNDFRSNGKTILFKIHGDSKWFLKHNYPLVFSQKEYATSIVKNKQVLNQLSSDLISNSTMFIGCSLDDEIDLIYSAATNDYTENNLKHTYFVTHDNLKLADKYRLKNFNIDTIIKLDSTDDYEDFYSVMVETHVESIKESRENTTLKFNPQVKRLYSTSETIEQDLNFLVNSNACFESLKDRNEINIPSFFMNRDLFSTKQDLEKLLKNQVSIIYGHRFSGKSFCLIDIYRKLSTENRLFFPPNISPNEDKIIEVIKKQKNITVFVDSNSIEENLLNFISKNQEFLVESSIRLIFTLTSADKENLYVLQKIKEISKERKINIGNYYLDNRLSKKETFRLNEKLGKTLLGDFLYDENKRRTILDNIFSLLSSRTAKIPFDMDITNRKIQGDLLNVDTIETLIILAIQNGRMTIKDIEKYYLNNIVGQIEKNYQPIIQFSYIDQIERSIEDTSAQKLICNSKVWLLFELQRLSKHQKNIEMITKAYQNIISAIKSSNSRDDRRARSQIARYIKFDEINDIFSDSKGARQLIDSIYEGLFGLLNDNFQYFHQRAKSLSWQDRDISALEKGLDFVDKAKHNVEIRYQKNNKYKSLEAYKHICYTKAMILTKIARFYDYKNYEYNNTTINSIKEAFQDQSNLNYLEEDNRRGEANSIVTFIRNITSNGIYDKIELKADLSYLFKITINDIEVPFNYVKYSRKRRNGSRKISKENY